MSIFDKIAAAVMPPESDEDRAEARRKAESLATGDDFLADVLDHHRQIEAAFASTLGASDAASRTAGLKNLGLVLTGHAIAEESVLYPALADNGEKAHAGMGYDEQAMVKVEMALLENSHRRYGSDAREEAGDARCLGSMAEDSTFCGKFGGLGVASCGGVMGG